MWFYFLGFRFFGGKVVIVIGVLSGIGEVVVRVLVENGVKVVLVVRWKERY